MKEWQSQTVMAWGRRRPRKPARSPWLPVSLSHSLTLPRLRSGYTLLELVLVLALLVVVAAIVYPSAEAMYGHFRLTQAADTIRHAWASARAHAIDEGVPYRFAIIPNQGNFRVAPDSPEYWSGSGQGQGAVDGANPPLLLNQSLPKGLRFSAPDAAPAPAQGSAGESSLPADSINPEMWSSRTVFEPDGFATQDVEIVFGANGTQGLVMRLRALTGAVTTRSRKLP